MSLVIDILGLDTQGRSRARAEKVKLLRWYCWTISIRQLCMLLSGLAHLNAWKLGGNKYLKKRSW